MLAVNLYRLKGGKLSLSALAKSGVDLAATLRYNEWLTERLCHHMNHHGQWTFILDIKGTSFTQITSAKFFLYIQSIASHDSVHYPDRLAILFVINVPMLFSAIWKLVSPFIDPVTVKKVLDPLLNLLYYDPCFAGLVCDLSQRLGRTFVQTQVYPRLVEIAGRAVVAAGRSGRLRPTPQATDHLGSALALLTAVRGHVDPAVVMRTLVEDTWRGEVQQPGLLLQVRFEE